MWLSNVIQKIPVIWLGYLAHHSVGLVCKCNTRIMKMWMWLGPCGLVVAQEEMNTRPTKCGMTSVNGWWHKDIYFAKLKSFDLKSQVSNLVCLTSMNDWRLVDHLLYFCLHCAVDSWIEALCPWGSHNPCWNKARLAYSISLYMPTNYNYVILYTYI